MTEEEKSIYPDIAEEIKSMQEKEQTLIRQTIDYGTGNNEYGQIIEEHTERMKKIIEVIGWPTIPKVGSKASHYAWNLVQHADHDIEFQKYSLELLKQQKEGEVLKKEIAYLTDKIAYNTGNLQTYGTQLPHNDKGEVTKPKDVIDPENLNQRRTEMGLEPLETSIIETARFYKRGYNLED